MSKFNVTDKRAPRTTSPITSTPGAVTYEGAQGYVRDARGELFLLAVSNMVGEATFYEKATDRDARFENLVHTVAVSHPDWFGQFVPWLRNSANMRSAPLVAALEGAKAMLGAKIPGGRKLVASAMSRADEPGEALSYWMGRYGRSIPKPVKRGIADAAARLYTERNVLKYDTASHGVRFADVLELCHVAPHSMIAYNYLYKHIIDRRHGHDPHWSKLPGESMLYRNGYLRDRSPNDFMGLVSSAHGPLMLEQAGFTWEDALSFAGKLDKKALWEALIPSMGYMALLRNLRNFDEAGVSDLVAGGVIAKLQDSAEVTRSRQLPMRFLSAYRAAPSLRWGYALEMAMQHSLGNIPQLPGRTLILIDTSGSMNEGFSKDGTLKRWDAAALFGIALGARCQEADVVSFSNSAMMFPPVKGESVLLGLNRFKQGGYFQGGGTATQAAVTRCYSGHDRVVVLTDEQAHYGSGYGGVDSAVPANIPFITWNLAGYRYGHAPSSTGNRYTFGGLSDAAFKMIPWLGAASVGRWPWEE